MTEAGAFKWAQFLTRAWKLLNRKKIPHELAGHWIGLQNALLWPRKVVMTAPRGFW
jgi:hypothetical protein